MVWAELGAVVAVTKKARTLATLGVLAPILMLGFQNCMVDLAKTTPGASSTGCSPTSTQLSDFQTVESAIIANTGSFTDSLGATRDGCASCHGSSSANSGKSVFLILTPPGGTPDTATSTSNFCSMQLKSRAKLQHPSEASHSGGVYSQSSIPSYYNLITTYF